MGLFIISIILGRLEAYREVQFLESFRVWGSSMGVSQNFGPHLGVPENKCYNLCLESSHRVDTKNPASP